MVPIKIKILKKTLNKKRAGHLWSKNRYMSAQIIKWIENERWIKLTKGLNNYALLLKIALVKIKILLLNTLLILIWYLQEYPYSNTG